MALSIRAIPWRAGVALLAIVFLAFGCAEEEMCTQLGVDGCYVEIGCVDDATCSLTAEEMNALCDCLGELDCDQSWYHTFCDDAPYPPDAGCITCEE